MTVEHEREAHEQLADELEHEADVADERLEELQDDIDEAKELHEEHTAEESPDDDASAEED
jgi:hypothetical protein